MKQVTFAAGLLALGLALGLVMPGVLAQEPPPKVQKWEQFCEYFDGIRGVRKGTESVGAHGKKGYQLAGVGSGDSTLILCYRRPAR